MGFIKVLTKLMHRFDFSAEPISININGRERKTSLLGGIVGLLIYTILLWFTITRADKLV